MKSPRFEIFKSDKDGQFYFRLRAKNGRIILASEGYTQKHNAEGGIEAVKWFSKFDDSFEVGDTFGYVGLGKIVSHHWFVLKSSNNEKIAQSETYTSKAGAKRGISSVRKNAPIAEIVDLSKD